MSNQIEESDKDPSIKDRFKNDEKIRQTILNRALTAWERLNENNYFTNDRDIDATREEWQSWRNSNMRFLYNNFEITYKGDDTIKKDKYIQEYNKFCKRKNYQPKSKRAITTEFSYMAGIGHDGKEYTGLAWKPTIDKSSEDVNIDDGKNLDDFDEEQDYDSMDLEKEIEKAQEGKLLEDEEELKKYLGEKNGRE